MTEFVSRLRVAVDLVERWDGEDAERLASIAALYDEISSEAPGNLEQLHRLPPAERLGLWCRLTRRGAYAAQKVRSRPSPLPIPAPETVSASNTSETSDGEVAWRRLENAGLRLEAATQAIARLSSRAVRRG